MEQSPGQCGTPENECGRQTDLNIADMGNRMDIMCHSFLGPLGGEGRGTDAAKDGTKAE